MSAPLRDVRPTRGFYADLHRQLPAERGEDGAPSRVDFELYDLVDILNTFVRDWDNVPPLIPGRSDYRILITAACWSPATRSRPCWARTA